MKMKATGTFKVGSQQDMQRACQAFILGSSILESNAFSEWFFDFNFTQISDEWKTVSTFGLYDSLFKEVTFTYQVVKRPFFKRWSSAIGYTVGNTITTYKNNFDAMAFNEIAAHIIHELTHVLGHGHAFNYSKERDSSVPYAVGNYVEKALKNLAS